MNSTPILDQVFPQGPIKDIPIHKAGVLAVEDSGVPKGQKNDCLTFLFMPAPGDLRQIYRFIAPLLHESGYRILVADLRGCGDSSFGFPTYTLLDISNDIIRILDVFNIQDSVFLVGSGSSVAAIIHASALYPQRFKGIVGLSPTVRDTPTDKWTHGMKSLSYLWPWGAYTWTNHCETLYKKRKPLDLLSYSSSLKLSLKEYSRMNAVYSFLTADRSPCFQLAENVKCPVLLIFGEIDPNFVNPLEEAHELQVFFRSCENFSWEILDGLGHFPHIEDPRIVSDMIISFSSKIYLMLS